VLLLSPANKQQAAKRAAFSLTTKTISGKVLENLIIINQ
jgi:hypothetical protein